MNLLNQSIVRKRKYLSSDVNHRLSPKKPGSSTKKGQNLVDSETNAEIKSVNFSRAFTKTLTNKSRRLMKSGKLIPILRATTMMNLVKKVLRKSPQIIKNVTITTQTLIDLTTVRNRLTKHSWRNRTHLREAKNCLTLTSVGRTTCL